MKKSRLGIFGKVFLYTILFLTIIITLTVIFFANQFQTILITGQMNQLIDNFKPLTATIENGNRDDVIKKAEEFHQKNTSFEFSLRGNNGEVLYETPNFDGEYDLPVQNFRVKDAPPSLLQNKKSVTIKAFGVNSGDAVFNGEDGESNSKASIVITNDISGDMSLFIMNSTSRLTNYSFFLKKTVIAIIILVIISVVFAGIFAHGITAPIKKLASDTLRMSNLENVPPPVAGNDEIGRLMSDVYNMYQKIKEKIEHEKQMEDNQRYFFLAASHELKTPLAAFSALIEEMLEGIAKPEEYQSNLRECMKLVCVQKKIIAEILEMVRLDNREICLNIENLNLRESVENVLADYEAISNAKNQEIIIEIPDDDFCTVDSNVFSKALSNIMMNAVQNTPDGGKIRIWSDSIEERITLNILNTCANIDDSIKEKLFDPFYRYDKARNREDGRTGLGLTLVKKALDLMDISFSLENSDDGVLFQMHLKK